MTSLVHLKATAPTAEILEMLHRDGAVIIDRAIEPDATARIRDELDPYFSAAKLGRDEFGGFKTKRLGALMARSPASRELALHPRVNEICASFLEPYCDSYQLHFTQAVRIEPGQGAQLLHRDRGVWGGYINRAIETQFSTIWAATDFTKANGATLVVPGSQSWDRNRKPNANEIVSAEMEAGSVLLYSGSVLHGGGSNQAQNARVGVLLHYTLSWLRQEENQYLSCPPEIAKDLSPELRSLMGYSKGGYVLGFFSTPGEPGEGFEIASPELLFGEREPDRTQAMSAEELVKSSAGLTASKTGI